MAFQFCKFSNNDIWQGDRLICTYLNLQMMKASPPPGGIKNIYKFISTLNKIYKYQTWQNERPVYTNFTLQVLMMVPPLGHMTNIYGFTTTFMSATWEVLN